jgi:hypothetical protein
MSYYIVLACNWVQYEQAKAFGYVHRILTIRWQCFISYRGKVSKMVNLYYGMFTEAVFKLYASEDVFDDIQTAVECTLITLQELG